MSLLLWISSLLWLETFKRATIKTKTHTLIKRIWAVIRFKQTSVICVIKAPLPPDQTDTMYQQEDTKLRIRASVKCYNVSQTFHPAARCYHSLRWIRHSKHPKPARPSDLRPNTRKYSPEICDRACGDRRVSSGVKSSRSWVLPVDRELSWKERLACVPFSLTHTHARARRDENAGMWRLVRFADRTRARGKRGLWEFEFKEKCIYILLNSCGIIFYCILSRC